MKKTYRVYDWDTGISHKFATCVSTNRKTNTGKRIWVDVKNGTEYVLERFANGLHFHHYYPDFE